MNFVHIQMIQIIAFHVIQLIIELNFFEEIILANAFVMMNIMKKGILQFVLNARKIGYLFVIHYILNLKKYCLS